MSSALNRLIDDDKHESVLGGYWVFIRRALWVLAPILLISAGVAMEVPTIWIAIIVGLSLGPLVTLERKFIEWDLLRRDGERNKTSAMSGDNKKQGKA